MLLIGQLLLFTTKICPEEVIERVVIEGEVIEGEVIEGGSY